jgi:hypothetical protein
MLEFLEVDPMTVTITLTPAEQDLLLANEHQPGWAGIAQKIRDARHPWHYGPQDDAGSGS